MRFDMGMKVVAVDCVFPDGSTVEGMWDVVGRRGTLYTLRRFDTTIQVQRKCLRLATQTIAPGSARGTR